MSHRDPDRTIRRQIARRRAGQSLLELIAATTIIAIVLVPALKLMRDSIRIGRQTETANILATFSMSKLEEHFALTAADWDTATDSGPIPNYAGLRFLVTKVDEGFGSGLMRITSTAYEDANNNDIFDSGERSAVFVGKVARNAAYEQEAS
ncbi:MAG: prepilin-type N-terminal cleavage/methylation domain-containing protein [Planctomycetes bacterium]|nr:prepilin-type N-terminal cleavage/methylation domain-containing protein [Planctomycetota bacterium]